MAPRQSERTRRPRGPVAWYGGKGRFAGWLARLVPQTQVYVEPFGGSASLLFSREPAPIEVYNDVDGRLVNLFRALQDPARRRRLERRLRCTFYARADFELAIAILKDRSSPPDPDDLAWAFFVAQNQCFGGIAEHRGQWARSLRPPTSRPRAWWSRVAEVERWGARPAGVQIEQREALEVLRYWDQEEATFYVDPPYVHDTRSVGSTNTYAAELDDDEHRVLLCALKQLRGACVLSGYRHPVYAELERAGWEVIERSVVCTFRRRMEDRRESTGRVEAVWRNPRAVKLLPV